VSEQGLVQKLVAQAAIEVLDGDILRRLAGIVVVVDLGAGSLGQDRVADQFGPIVADDRLGPTARGDDRIKLAGDPAPRQRDIGHRRQAFRARLSQMPRMWKRGPLMN
jgi:hypothetical protein